MYWVLAVFGGIEHAAVPKLEPLMRLMLSKNFGYKVQSSLRDSGEYDENPGVKTPGYFRIVATRLKSGLWRGAPAETRLDPCHLRDCVENSEITRGRR